jgi:hypothetical protein
MLYLAFEGGLLTQQRWVRMCNALGIDRAALPLEIRTVAGAYNAELFSKLQDRLRRDEDNTGVAPGVIIDTLTSALRGVDQNSAAYADPLWDLGNAGEMFSTPITVCAHHNKGEGRDELHSISGHNSIPSACQTQIVIRPDAADSTHFTMTCGRSPVMPFRARHGRWVDVQDPRGADSPGARLLGTAWGLKAELLEDAGKKEKASDVTERITRQIYAALQSAPPYGLSQRAIFGQVSGNDKQKKTVLEDLASKKQVLLEMSGNTLLYKKKVA